MRSAAPHPPSRRTAKSFARVRRLALILFATGLLCACGSNSPTRYHPAPPSVPGGLTVTGTSDGQVSLGWAVAPGAAAYNVYFSQLADAVPATATLFATTAATSVTVTGLRNETPYFFLLSSVNSGGESAATGPVTATPAGSGDFVQADLSGDPAGSVVWRFNILAAGASAGWMRGDLAVDGSGGVTVTRFLDSAGGTAVPAELFPELLVDPSGEVTDGDPAAARFHGSLASSRRLLIGTLTLDAGSPALAVLQRHDPGVSFGSDDLKGFGQAGGGARRFAYGQLSTGALPEWEFAQGRIGQDLAVQYAVFLAPSNPVAPGRKATALASSPEGIVTESRNPAVSPQPPVVISAGTLSGDKSMIVATETDDTGPDPKYLLRIYQVINIVFGDTNTLSGAELEGRYRVHMLAVGADPASADGLLEVDAEGNGSFLSYADSAGGTEPPPGPRLNVDADGILSDPGDGSLHGKLGYFKEVLLWTRTEPSGTRSLFLGVK